MTHQIRQRDAELVGEQRGIAIGKQHGILIGEQRGKRERDKQIVQNMLAAGMSIDMIVSVTGLTPSEIKALEVKTIH